MLFHARKTATPSVIFEHVFEMIALFYLNDVDTLQGLVKQYYLKYPDGLMFLSQALPAILFDEDLVAIIIIAFENIILLHENNPEGKHLD